MSFKVGDRVRVTYSVPNTNAWSRYEYIILAGPREGSYDDGSLAWTEYAGIMVSRDRQQDDEDGIVARDLFRSASRSDQGQWVQLIDERQAELVPTSSEVSA